MSDELAPDVAEAPPARGVEVERIEAALASMWSEAGEAKHLPGDHKVIRACTVNLVVYTTPADDRDQLSDLLAEINHEHPGRTLLLVANRGAGTPRIEANISMRCRLGAVGKQVCGEEITIEADGARIDTAASAIEALLVPGVPVYVWWKGTPNESDLLFDRLTRMADRVVIDSAKFALPAADLLRLARLIGDPRSRMRVSDLNWGRMTAWFTLLAGLWDVPDYRPVLDRIDRLELAYRPQPNGSRAMAPRPLMLAGWIASRLGWEVVGSVPHHDVEGASWKLRAHDRDVLLAIRGDTAGAAADARIASVLLSAGDGAGAFFASLAPDNSRIKTDARIGNTRSAARVLSYTSRTDADRLSGELDILRRDTVYEAAMRSAGQLVEACPRLLRA
ncbi:MAG: glucose-6-phosphate dehydrogenase assembly protein OpcA [Burkholderiales bacterium]|nr:glucose-6-phosphate dehydrogenase assembly protein OpcA [Burkholderiales bacterium]